jgi:hypothetical protein
MEPPRRQEKEKSDRTEYIVGRRSPGFRFIVASLAEVKRLDDLMEVYRRALVRKARAMKVAVERSLKPPLN